MPKHADDEPVLVGFSSSRNISMNGAHEEIGITWGEWRQMTEKQRNEVLNEYIWELVDVYVEDQDDED